MSLEWYQWVLCVSGQIVWETKTLNVLNQETQSKVDYCEEHKSNYPLSPCALSRLALSPKTFVSFLLCNKLYPVPPWKSFFFWIREVVGLLPLLAACPLPSSCPLLCPTFPQGTSPGCGGSSAPGGLLCGCSIRSSVPDRDGSSPGGQSVRQRRDQANGSNPALRGVPAARCWDRRTLSPHLTRKGYCIRIYCCPKCLSEAVQRPHQGHSCMWMPLVLHLLPCGKVFSDHPPFCSTQHSQYLCGQMGHCLPSYKSASGTTVLLILKHIAKQILTLPPLPFHSNHINWPQGD